MKAVRLLIGVIALVLVVVGVAVAIVLGPDDTWGGEPAVLPDSAPVIATAPQLLNVAGAELRVSATTDEGEAFVGAGHPVHVQDYVRDVERTEITQLSADGVGGSEGRAGERAYPAVVPAELDVWDVQATGADVTLEVPLTDEAPVQVAVMPAADGGSAPQVGIGYALPGAFLAALVAAVVGLLLLVGTIVWGRRAKGAAPAAATEPQESGSGAMLSRGAVRVAAIGSVLAVTAGCSIPHEVEHGEQPGVVPLQQADAQAVLDDYDVRNNAAIKASATGDGSRWKRADTGPFLATDELSARTSKFFPPKAKGDSDFVHRAKDVFEVEQSAYPLSSVVDVEVPGRDLQGGQLLYVYSKAGAAGPWKGYSSIYLPSRLVTPLPAGEATPTHEDRLSAARWDAELDQRIAYGKDTDLRIPQALQEDINEMSYLPKGVERVNHSVRPWGGRRDGRTEQDGPVRVLRVKQGLLVITHKEWELSLYLKSGFEWNQTSRERKVHGSHDKDTVYDEHYLLTAAILVPHSGAPSVIGSEVERVLDFPPSG